MNRNLRRARVRRRATAATFAGLASLIPLTAACSSDSHPTVASAGSSADPDASSPASRSSACRPVPPQGAALDWLPADLPLPAGSYPIQDVDAAAAPPSVPSSGTHRGLLAVHSSVTDFSAFIQTEWTSKGWSLGKGDAERGEAEGGYRRGNFGGAYRVRDVYCDPTFTELLLVYGQGPTTESS